MVNINAGTNEFASLCAFTGGFILCLGLVSFILKEKIFLSDSLLATLVGVAFGPIAINLINPYEWSGNLQRTIFQFADLVINIQIMAVAIALPRSFWKRRKRGIAFLLGPVTLYMWLASAIIFWKIIGMGWVESMVLAACAAPTDPVLANSIVNGRFADLHIHPRIRSLLSAESAANDGAAAPFFYLGIYLLKYSVGEAFAKWSYNIVLFEVGLAFVLGFVIGYSARVALRYSDENNWIDKKNFLVFELALAAFTTGVATMLSINSFITVLITGITFAWDGWFSKETEEAHVQEVIDLLVNLVFFLMFGTVIPWQSFNTELVPIWRFVVAAILLLLFRRLPIVLLLGRYMSPRLSLSEAMFVGWFGPIGVGALWYQGLASFFFPDNPYFFPVMCFVVFSSVIAHGIMVPIVHLTITTIKSRTLSRTVGGLTSPQWPNAVPMSTNAISGPVGALQTADGRALSAEAVLEMQRQNELKQQQEMQEKKKLLDESSPNSPDQTLEAETPIAAPSQEDIILNMDPQEDSMNSLVHTCSSDNMTPSLLLTPQPGSIVGMTEAAASVSRPARLDTVQFVFKSDDTLQERT